MDKKRRPVIRTIEQLMIDPEIKAVEMVLEPWLPVRGLAMLVGWRGVGKTMVALGTALAIGSGGTLLGWKATQPRRVLYCDGEMALVQMQSRSRALVEGHPSLGEGAKNVILFSHEDQQGGIQNLIRFPSARREIEMIMAEQECEALFLDNLSSLCNSEDENDAASWVIMQEWLIDLRRKGKTVVFVHHTGKPDEHGFVKQRGSSKREDVLDTSIILRGDGARGFRVIYDKHRGFEPPPEHLGQMIFSEGKCVIEAKAAPVKTEKMPAEKLSRVMAATGRDLQS